LAAMKLSAAPSPNCLPNHLCSRPWGRHSPMRQSHTFQLCKGIVKGKRCTRAREEGRGKPGAVCGRTGNRPPRANWRAQVVVVSNVREALGRPPRGLPGAFAAFASSSTQAAAGCGLVDDRFSEAGLQREFAVAGWGWLCDGFISPPSRRSWDRHFCTVFSLVSSSARWRSFLFSREGELMCKKGS
jgi:hypothetical protein